MIVVCSEIHYNRTSEVGPTRKNYPTMTVFT